MIRHEERAISTLIALAIQNLAEANLLRAGLKGQI